MDGPLGVTPESLNQTRVLLLLTVNGELPLVLDGAVRHLQVLRAARQELVGVRLRRDEDHRRGRHVPVGAQLKGRRSGSAVGRRQRCKLH